MFLFITNSRDSSVGRVEDCKSFGRRFESGSRDFKKIRSFIYNFINKTINYTSIFFCVVSTCVISTCVFLSSSLFIF